MYDEDFGYGNYADDRLGSLEVSLYDLPEGQSRRWWPLKGDTTEVQQKITLKSLSNQKTLGEIFLCLRWTPVPEVGQGAWSWGESS